VHNLDADAEAYASRFLGSDVTHSITILLNPNLREHRPSNRKETFLPPIHAMGMMYEAGDRLAMPPDKDPKHMQKSKSRTVQMPRTLIPSGQLLTQCRNLNRTLVKTLLNCFFDPANTEDESRLADLLNEEQLKIVARYLEDLISKGEAKRRLESQEKDFHRVRRIGLNSVSLRT
jgi:hypothetical protein